MDGSLYRMKPFSFRQWIACAVMVAMLLNMAAPLSLYCCGECRCEGCPRELSILRFMSGSVIESEKSCCASPLSSAEKGYCGSPEEPCNCQCGNYQENDIIVPKAVLLVKRTDIKPSWDSLSVLPIGFTNTLDVFSRFDACRTLLPSHVALHILLCVLLN